MPPLRSSRVSKACTLCRKQKTRCYPCNGDDETCLRCETLAQTCSLSGPSTVRQQTTSTSIAPGSHIKLDSNLINERCAISNSQQVLRLIMPNSNAWRDLSQALSRDWTQRIVATIDHGARPNISRTRQVLPTMSIPLRYSRFVMRRRKWALAHPPLPMLLNHHSSVEQLQTR